MYKSHFGRNGQVGFSCPEEYYELLGYLAKSDGTTSITWENNEDQGAWGSEGRICFHTRKLPLIGSLRFTAGNGSIYKRVKTHSTPAIHFYLGWRGHNMLVENIKQNPIDYA